MNTATRRKAMHQVCDEREAPEDPPDDPEPVCGLCEHRMECFSDDENDVKDCPIYELDRAKLESMMEVEP